MASKVKISDRLKQIVRQYAGNIKDNGEELIPQVAIRGTGHLWCYCPSERNFVRVIRGLIAYVVDEKINEQGRVLIYTNNADLVEIEPDELIDIGYD